MSPVASDWQAVAEMRKTLPAVVCLVSLPGSDGRRGGVTTEADRETAAKLVVGESHRLATAAEAEAFQAEQARRTKLNRSVENARTGRIA